MSKVKIHLTDFRALKSEDLTKKIGEAKLKIANLKGQLAVGKLKNFKDIKSVRRQLASMLTVEKEKLILSHVENNEI